MHFIQNKIGKDSFNMAKCFRTENTNFTKMPAVSSYDQGTCVCSSRTMSTATAAISKVSREKKKKPSEDDILEYNDKGGELTAKY